MNLLTDRLPERVKVGRSIFELNTDFRAGVSFELMAEAGETDYKKLLRPFFDEIPKDIAGALEAALWFYRCGQEPEEKVEKKVNKQAYSFSADSEAIIADFRHFYSVDISSSNMHWWTFRALLLGLPEDSNFKQRIYYRTCDTKDLPKKEKQRVLRIRKRIKINKETGGKKMTLEERNQAMKDYIARRSAELRG